MSLLCHMLAYSIYFIWKVLQIVQFIKYTKVTFVSGLVKLPDFMMSFIFLFIYLSSLLVLKTVLLWKCSMWQKYLNQQCSASLFYILYVKPLLSLRGMFGDLPRAIHYLLPLQLWRASGYCPFSQYVNPDLLWTYNT